MHVLANSANSLKLVNYRKRVRALKYWIETEEIILAEYEYQPNSGEDNLLQLAIEYRDLPTIDYLLDIITFPKDSLIDQATWDTINKCLKEEEQRFEGFKNYGFFHQNLTALVHQRIEREKQKKLIQNYGLFGLIYTSIGVVVLLIVSPHLIKLIGHGIQSVGYAIKSIRDKFFYKTKRNADEGLENPQTLFNERYPTSETNKTKAKISKTSIRLSNYTALGYALAATTLTVVTVYAAPILVKIGQAALSSALSFGLMAISGILLTATELWMARSYHLKIREDEKNIQIDMAKLNTLISEVEAAPQSLEQAKKIADLKYQQTEITSYYQTQILSNTRYRNAAVVSAVFFALASIATFIPVLTPFSIPIAALAGGIWLAARLIVYYQDYKMNLREQNKLITARTELEKEYEQIEIQFASSVANVSAKDIFNSSNKTHEEEQEEQISKHIVPVTIRDQERHLFFSSRDESEDQVEIVTTEPKNP